MKKQQLSIFLFVVMFSCLVLPAYAAKAEPYKDQKNGYSIVFPDGWEVKENINSILAIALSPKENDADIFRENVNISIEELPSEMTAVEYMKAGESALSNSLAGYEKLDGGGNKDFAWVKYSHEMRGYKFTVTSNAFVKGKRAYIVTCTAIADTFGKYKNTFDATVKSFIILAK